jgi:hypothetical protein
MPPQMTDEQRWKIVRALCGHVEDGSSVAVLLVQDDATRGWSVRVGRRYYHADSLDQALTDAAAANGVCV